MTTHDWYTIADVSKGYLKGPSSPLSIANNAFCSRDSKKGGLFWCGAIKNLLNNFSYYAPCPVHGCSHTLRVVTDAEVHDKRHKPYRSSPITSPIAMLLAWRVLSAMVYHRKSAARESLSTDPLLVRATLKDMTSFQCAETCFLHFKGPAGPSKFTEKHQRFYTTSSSPSFLAEQYL